MKRCLPLLASLCLTPLALANCAAPPLTLYTLDTQAAPTKAAPLGRTPVVIAVARVHVVALLASVLDRLAAAIEIPGLPPIKSHAAVSHATPQPRRSRPTAGR